MARRMAFGAACPAMLLTLLLAATPLAQAMPLAQAWHSAHREVLGVDLSTERLQDRAHRHGLHNQSHTADSQPIHHRVEHVALLNRDRFWWLMGALIATVAAGVIHMEVNHVSDVQSSQLEDPAPSESPSDMSTDVDMSPSAVRPKIPHVISLEELTGGRQPGGAWNLTFCIVGLTISMLLWGIAQEFIMTQTYYGHGSNGEKVPSTLSIVLCNRIFTAVFALVILRLRSEDTIFLGFWASAGPAASNALASFCQYQSLLYVSFSLQTTAKCAKLLPVVIMSSLRGKRHSVLEYAEAIVIVAGLVIFGLETDGNEQEWSITQLGVLCLVVLLVADSATPHLQDAIFANYEVSPLQATYSMAAIASGGIILVLLVTGNLFQTLAFFARFPEARLHTFVLSFASCMTQYLISHTIKHFGPVTFTMIASTRQLTSVIISVVLFRHNLNVLAWIAMLVVFGVVFFRTFRPARHQSEREQEQQTEVLPGIELEGSPEGRSFISFCNSIRQTFVELRGEYGYLMVCALGIQVCYMFYALTQEYLTAHTWNRQLFSYPLFLVAASHTAGSIFAALVMWLQHVPLIVPSQRMTLAPAMTNLVSSFLQHRALYSLYFPAQTLLKTLKILPVMVAGWALKNRHYSRLDYLEGIVLTVLVALFVWEFQVQDNVSAQPESSQAYEGSIAGIVMMLGYVALDPFTSNLEDYAYQVTDIEPSQMLFGMEALSACVAWVVLLSSGEFSQAIHFLVSNPDAVMILTLLSIAGATGAYTCLVTVRLFGPSIFTLLMMSRQICSLVISVLVFQHPVQAWECVAFVIVAMLLIASSVRRVRVGAGHRKEAPSDPGAAYDLSKQAQLQQPPALAAPEARA